LTSHDKLVDLVKNLLRVLDPDFISAGDAVSQSAWDQLLKLKEGLK